jgi:hypothetical protein
LCFVTTSPSYDGDEAAVAIWVNQGVERLMPSPVRANDDSLKFYKAPAGLMLTVG